MVGVRTLRLIPPYIAHVIVFQLYGSRYPTWRSLARDYLFVMASSVSSERVFSQAGITISKRRNRLNANIVEALQCLRCLIQQDLMVRASPTLADQEQDLDFDDDQAANQDCTPMEVVDAGDDVTWGAPTSDDCKGVAEAGGHDTDITLD